MLRKIAITLSIVFASLLLAGFTNQNLSEIEIKSKFAAIQKDYFPKLDFRAPKQEIQTIPEFAANLSALANEQKSILKTSNNLTKEDKEIAGLIFIYDAMLNSNIIVGVLNNKIMLADFVQVKRFAKSGATKREELRARAKYAMSNLLLAAKLRPSDRRIDSWIVGAKGIAEMIETGHISKTTQAAVMKAVSVRPSFNLWTAILLLHNEPQSSKQALVAASKNFVDLASKGQDACTLHPEDCLSTWKAPYNFQAAVTELGDVFLQQAEFSLEKGDIENAMMMAGYADGTYAQLSKPTHIGASQKWPDYDVIALRKSRLADVQKRITPKDSMRNLTQYQRAYECASCHGRVSETH